MNKARLKAGRHYKLLSGKASKGGLWEWNDRGREGRFRVLRLLCWAEKPVKERIGDPVRETVQKAPGRSQSLA
jgi:hypothetical protein